MSTDQSRSAAAADRIDSRRRLAQSFFRYAGAMLRNAPGLIVRLAVVGYFIFALLFLSLRYVILPNIDRYKDDVEQIAARVIGSPVTISTIYASWQGVRPYLFLGGVEIYDRNGKPALQLPGVAATFSWWSVVIANVRLHSLEISRPDLDIERDADGRLFVGGIYVDPEQPGDGKGLDWVLEQREIVIRDGRLSWNDRKRGAPPLTLDSITVLLRNDWHRHQVALTATPPASVAAPLDVRAAFAHPRFVHRMSDVSQWTGELYADLRDADLAIWNTYIDYPFAVSRGKGAVRAWLAFDRARIANFTADLQLANVSARLRQDLQPLNLSAVRGRVSMREEFDPMTVNGDPAFGRQGHSIALTDFSFETDDGLLLPPTTIRETYRPARGGIPERTDVNVGSLDLHALANLIERLPLPPDQLRMLTDYAPRGRLQDFSASWQGSYPDIVSYDVKGRFSGLTLKAQAARPARAAKGTVPAQAAVPAIPGFDNLTGALQASDKGGSLRLASKDLMFHLPGYVDVPTMAFDHLRMRASWTFEPDSQLLLEMHDMEFLHEGISGALQGSHRMPLVAAQDQSPGSIDLTVRIDRLDIGRIGRYLPVGMPEHVRRWLSGGLMAGTAEDIRLRIQGDLADFPFARRDAGREPSGLFTVDARIRDGRLNYTPGQFGKDGKKPFWPLLDQIDGTLSFNRSRLEIHAAAATTQNVALSAVKAVVPDLLVDDVVLDIDGEARGPLQEFVHYANASPVIDWIGGFTEQTRASGDARLALKLRLPLGRPEQATVLGSLLFANNDVVLQDAMPPLSGVSGRLEFTEQGFTLHGMRAGFVGGPVSAFGGTQKDGSIAIRAEGSLSSAGLRKIFDTPATQRLASRISGASRYSAMLRVRNQRLELLVESSLQGVALDFPAPLGKAVNETMPVRFELTPLPSENSVLARDELKLTLGSAMAARYQREKRTGSDAAWRVIRGGIGVNVPAPVPDSGLTANVNLESLNIDAWSRIVGSVIGDAGMPSDGASPDGAAEALGIAQYIEPEVVAARATELIIGGKKLDNVVVGASHYGNVWQANIDSAQASGYVTWNEGGHGQGLGKVTARLASLVIPRSAASDVGDLLEGKNATTQIPALDIIADEFELFDKKLGRLELLADNIATPEAREWRISRLAITNPDGALLASGNWAMKDGGSKTNLDYGLEIADAGRLLDRFGFADVLRGGRGRMDGDISWQGLPFSLDVPSLSGQVRLDMTAGQFLKVDPGAAKLLGVLSLQSLPRRLALDFRDVFSEGFAFDGIAATARIAKGVARTDSFKMRSVNATVLIDGSADIAQESQNLHVTVIPEINAGTASVVYALAVNPLVGVGTFLAQLFLREPLMKAFTFEYSVTGPWKDPVVTKLERDGIEAPRAAPFGNEGAG
jgi:uncharacterized protein (TIGR02099 family)